MRSGLALLAMVMVGGACTSPSTPVPTKSQTSIRLTTTSDVTSTSTRPPAPTPGVPDRIVDPVIVMSRFDDFTMTIPGDWILLTASTDELTALGSNLATSLPGLSGSALVEDADAITAVTALWAQSTEPSGFRENIQVLRIVRHEELDLAALAETAAADLASLGLVNLSESDTTLAGLAGLRFASETPPGPGPPIFQSSVFLLGTDYVWIINFATDAIGTFSLFEAVLESFQLVIPNN